MRLSREVTGCVVLLVGAVGCGGDGTSTPSTTAGTTDAAGAEVTLEACPGAVPGLFAVEPSGALRWSRCDESGSHQLMTIAVADGLVYVVEQPSSEPSLVALDLDDGTEVWRFAFSSLNEGFGYEAVRAFDMASFAAGGVIVLDVLASTGVDHVGLDARSGEQRWRVADDGGLVTLNTDELVVTSVGFGGDLAGSGPTGRVAAGHEPERGRCRSNRRFGVMSRRSSWVFSGPSALALPCGHDPACEEEVARAHDQPRANRRSEE